MDRELTISCRMARIALLDVVEGRERCIVRQNEDGSYSFRMEVFGRICGFTAWATPAAGGCVLTARLTETSAGLSSDGETRVLRYLLDSVEQLTENEQYNYAQRRDAASEGEQSE